TPRAPRSTLSPYTTLFRSRDAGEMRVGRRCRGQWRERRICVVYGVTEPAREREAEAIASGSGNGEPATRHDDSVGPDAGAILEGHEPALTLSHDVDDAGTEAEARARAASDGKQSVAHITGTVAPREQLPGFRLEIERHAQLGLEE